MALKAVVISGLGFVKVQYNYFLIGRSQNHIACRGVWDRVRDMATVRLGSSTSLTERKHVDSLIPEPVRISRTHNSGRETTLFLLPMLKVYSYWPGSAKEAVIG